MQKLRQAHEDYDEIFFDRSKLSSIEKSCLASSGLHVHLDVKVPHYSKVVNENLLLQKCSKKGASY